MSGRIYAAAVFMIVGICTLPLSGCSSPAGQPDLTHEEEAMEFTPVFDCTKADLDTDARDAVSIDLSGTEADYTITDAGNYLLSGSCDGSICIDAEEQIVHLLLNDVDIRCPFGPAIDIRSAGKVVITLMEGTSNVIRDSAAYQKRDERDAAVYSVCDLTFNGSGALSVYGFHDNAIHSKDVVKLLDAEIFIQAKGNGIQGNDGVLVNVLSLDIESEENGLYSTKTGSRNKGTIEISGGEISVIAGRYAVSSANDIYVYNCSVWSNAVLGSLNAPGSKYLLEGCMEDE